MRAVSDDGIRSQTSANPPSLPPCSPVMATTQALMCRGCCPKWKLRQTRLREGTSPPPDAQRLHGIRSRWRYQEQPPHFPSAQSRQARAGRVESALLARRINAAHRLRYRHCRTTEPCGPQAMHSSYDWRFLPGVDACLLYTSDAADEED